MRLTVSSAAIPTPTLRKAIIVPRRSVAQGERLYGIIPGYLF
ncbi:hypothetical protein [Desulfitobacterium hafniense]|nr:hypothetical protein [Desulfitobacterium hafniense]